MRIVAGVAKGRVLLGPSSERVTRPTADRVRETLFNILGQELEPLDVLDLFAGTGALALEAISRGAARAVVVERDREALSLIRMNAQALGFLPQLRVIGGPVEKALQTLGREGARFPLVFADPPYALEVLVPTLQALVSQQLLDPGALVVFEHGKQELAPDEVAGLTREDQRTFGATRVSFYRAA